MLPLTKKVQKLYNKQNFCHVCHEKIDEEPSEDIKAIVKVRDHCHYTGKYWGAAYSICNVKYQTSKEIPVVLNNGSNYDYRS